MKSDRWHELTKTFRFRLAMQHTVLISAALCVTFLVALAAVRAMLFKAGQGQLNSSLLLARAAYIGGQMGEQTEQLPETVLNRLMAQFPSLHIGQVEIESQPGGMLYEVLASTGKEWLEILADPDGKIWVAARKPLEELFASLNEIVRVELSGVTDVLLYSPGRELLAGTLHGERSQAAAEELMLMPVDEEMPLVIRRGNNLFGRAVLFDGNVLLITATLETVKQVMLLGIGFFVLLLFIFIPFSIGIGLHLSRKAMADVRRVSRAARKIENTGDFKGRVTPIYEGAEIRELVDAFNAMVLRIDTLMRELRDVTINIAHDLKTPIMRIRGLIEGSEWEENTQKEREQMLASAIEECDRIAPLIDSILELSRADAGMLVLHQDAFNLADEVRSAHEIFSTLAEDRGIRFEYHVSDPSIPMVGDRQRLQRIIANLIENALKYTPDEGRILIEVVGDPDTATLTVCDTGPGIPAEEVDRVFEPFYRIDQSRTLPGHGLGLSMVKAFVTAWGGRITIDSEVGAGCTVTVELPTRIKNG